MMNQNQQDEFWRLYGERGREAIERACQRASRSLTDSTMDEFDMVAWCEDRIWRMLRLGQAPTFHDDPTPAQAMDRIVNNARTLARWAYLALSRKHWRQMERSKDIVAALSRTERLAATRATDVELEKKEEIEAKLASIRDSISEKVRQRAAASWNDVSERHHIAKVLDVEDEAGQELLDRTMSGQVRVNTIEQMRSRALRRMRDVMARSGHAVKLLLIVGVAAFALGSGSQAFGGEQSGGRRDGMSAGLVVSSINVGVLATESGGEQSGGRGGG